MGPIRCIAGDSELTLGIAFAGANFTMPAVGFSSVSGISGAGLPVAAIDDRAVNGAGVSR